MIKTKSDKKVKPTYGYGRGDASESGGADFRRAWRKPVVSRIEIKRTLSGPGSLADGPGLFSSTPG